MNPWGLVIMALGIILCIIAFHGSQSGVLTALKGATKQ